MFFFHNWHRVLGRIVPTAASILLISSLRGFFFCEFQREPSQSPSVITIKKTVIGDVTRRPLKGLGLGHDNNLSSLAEIASLSIVFKTLLWKHCEVWGESFGEVTRIQAPGFPTVSVHIKRGQHLCKPLTSGYKILIWEAACRWTAYIPAPWNHKVNIKALYWRGIHAKKQKQNIKQQSARKITTLAFCFWGSACVLHVTMKLRPLKR